MKVVDLPVKKEISQLLYLETLDDNSEPAGDWQSYLKQTSTFE